MANDEISPVSIYSSARSAAAMRTPGHAGALAKNGQSAGDGTVRAGTGESALWAHDVKSPAT
jgi:hypothetical protein